MPNRRTRPPVLVDYRRNRGCDAEVVAVIALLVISLLLFICAFALLRYANSAALAKSSITSDDETRLDPALDCTSKSCLRLSRDICIDADPCDDFYKFTCGGYQNRHRYQPGTLSHLDDLDWRIVSQLKEILENTSPMSLTNESMPVISERVRRYYNACQSSVKFATYPSGQATLSRMVADLGGFWTANSSSSSSSHSLAELLAKIHSYYAKKSVFLLSVEPNPFNVSEFAVLIRESSTASKQHQQDDDSNIEALVNFENYLRLAELLGPPGQTVLNISDIRAVLDVESAATKLQQAYIDKNGFELVDVQWLNDNLKFINWDRYFAEIASSAGVPAWKFNRSTSIVVKGVGLLKKMSQFFTDMLETEEKSQHLHNYIVFRAILNYQKRFRVGGDFGSKIDCVSETRRKLDYAVGALFVDRNFERIKLAKDQVEVMADHIFEAYGEVVQKSVWLDDEAKGAVLEKLQTLTTTIGFEPWLRNETFVVKELLDFNVGADFAANELALHRFKFMKSIQALFEKPDSSMFGFGPANARAYHMADFNRSAILAALLDDPVFYNDSDNVSTALNYGAVGFVIGHELSHSLNLVVGRNTTWPGHRNETSATYRQRAACFVDQFNKCCAQGFCVDGEKTLAENFADTEGLRVAFRAFQLAITKHENRSKNLIARLRGLELTSEQLFFVGFGRMWCYKYGNDGFVENTVKFDNHSPPNCRVTGAVDNLEEFAQTFKCPSCGQPRCLLW